MWKDVRWHWTEEQQEAFEKLKLALIQAPVLVRPDLSLPFTLKTDASDYAIAGMLTQVFIEKSTPSVLFVEPFLELNGITLSARSVLPFYGRSRG